MSFSNLTFAQMQQMVAEAMATYNPELPTTPEDLYDTSMFPELDVNDTTTFWNFSEGQMDQAFNMAVDHNAAMDNNIALNHRAVNNNMAYNNMANNNMAYDNMAYDNMAYNIMATRNSQVDNSPLDTTPPDGHITEPDSSETRSSSSVPSPRLNQYQKTMAEMVAREARRAARKTKRATQRPRGPKLRCGQCSEDHEGFRGRHELERHRRAKHNQQVDRYHCVGPLDGTAIAGGLTIHQPFHGCSYCRGHKQYNSEQNAIDHLRRRHFSAKKERGGPPVLVNIQELTVEKLRPFVQRTTITTPAPVHGNNSAAAAPPPATGTIPAAVTQPPIPATNSAATTSSAAPVNPPQVPVTLLPDDQDSDHGPALLEDGEEIDSTPTLFGDGDGMVSPPMPWEGVPGEGTIDPSFLTLG
ncbi:hypothetical protein A9Z42_0092150 [Trichoderma parareesei]|uniref:C2H2-type domain-containing protein n=1 Tax=Trichoderma parareesei TaxID=858221 RepID=A0A2H2ZNC5_TRIPA|nr:hypothetical protein A9Z42_0092150 [Trichoderma parareesei]